MRKIITTTFVTLDDVMQAPGGPKEDASGDFKYGGWMAHQEWDEMMGQTMNGFMQLPFELLLGRVTYDIFASYWPTAKTDSEVALLFNANKKYVVSHKVFAPEWQNTEYVSGGSGFIIAEDGTVITNSHIIPQDESNVLVPEDGCLVYLYNSDRGELDEIYLARPAVIIGLSDQYDLATLKIHAGYRDADGVYGHYPKKFTKADASSCAGELKLGEPILVYGYPSVSGGYSLTVTDGVISSFQEDGSILTSAKINYGNSGGLAVDALGCPVGVPSAFLSAEGGNLGVLISMAQVLEFFEAVDRERYGTQ